LSWEAATKRLEAAGSIPVKEAELRAEALSSARFEVRSRALSMYRVLITKSIFSLSLLFFVSLDYSAPFDRGCGGKEGCGIWIAKNSSEISNVPFPPVAGNFAEQW
jgi:hypothetical protein